MNSPLKGLIWLVMSFAIFYTNAASASVYICESDPNVINYINQGQVVTSRGTKSSCPYNGNIQLKLDYPSSTGDTIVCGPSDPSNIPDGFVAIESDYYSNCRVGTNAAIGYKIKRPSANQQICDLSGTRIPSGFIVYQKNITTTRCAPSTNPYATYAMKIKIPSASPGTITTVCQSPGHDLPTGFVITKYKKSTSCGSSVALSGIAYEIMVPKPSVITTVCQASPIPAGFSYFATGTYSGCGFTGTGSGQGFKIGPVTGNTANICGGNRDHVPPGYVVTSISSSSRCGSTYGSLTLTKVSTSGAMTACMIGGVFIVPNGFVITKTKVSSSSCLDGPSYTMQQPSGNSQFICQATPSIPGGWAVQSTDTSSSCPYSNTTTGQHGPSAIIVPMTGDGPFSICAGTQIPTGFVINREMHLWSCSNKSGYAVVRPDETRGVKTVVCDSFSRENIPSGFVITDNLALSTQCSSTGSGYKVSKPLLDQDNIVCAGSIIPDNFVIKATDYYGNCGSFQGGAGRVIGTVTGNGPFYLCAGSNIPNGYVVIEASDSISSCAAGVGAGAGMKIILADPSKTISVCAGFRLPESFIVNKVEHNSSCAFDSGFKIKVPSQTSSTFVCDVYETEEDLSKRPVPAGFIKIAGSQKNSASCSLSSLQPGSSYEISLSSNQVVPVPFINAEVDVISKPADASVLCSNNSASTGLIGNAVKNPSGCN